jgi:adenylate cyclase
MEKQSILIVDDAITNTKLLAGILKSRGYHVMIANGGLEALELLETQEAPDLIILDVMMPDLDGFEVCRRLKENPRLEAIPVIFASALSEPEHVVTGLEVGGVDYIGKPFNMAEILARVKIHMTMRSQQRELQAQYQEIERLQRVVRKFLSDSAWQSIEADLGINQSVHQSANFESMTLMFTDVAQFTTISEGTDPELLMADLVIYMNVLSWVIHSHNGQIDKFLGDGIFAFFEDANDALNASIDIQRELLKFNAEQEEHEREMFLTRIGLATGRILQATLGFDDRLEHTIIGDRVNTAARLQGEAPVGGVLMDEPTYIAVGQPDISLQDSIELKGKANLEQIYAILPEDIFALPS